MNHINLFQTVAEFESAYTNDYKEPWVSYTIEGSGLAYNKKSGPIPHDYSQDYLTFVMLEDGGTITSNTDGVELSKDGGLTWTSGETGNLSAGDKVLVRGSAPGMGSDTAILHCDKKYNVEGNIMSIYNSEDFRTRTAFDDENDNLMAMFSSETNLISAENLILPVTALTHECYYRMFDYCTGLTTAPELPATTLASSCYYEMFYGCTSLATAPELPATTLANNCYDDMFGGCTSLTTAPELPATTLTNYCYRSMFSACTKLNYIKCLATDISATSCTNYWVDGVASTGTFVKDASMAGWTTGDDGIPGGWTVQDAS